MKNLSNVLILGISLISMLSSCSMEKKVYSRGYHVEWRKIKNDNSITNFEKSVEETTENISIDIISETENKENVNVNNLSNVENVDLYEMKINEQNVTSLSVIEPNIDAKIQNKIEHSNKLIGLKNVKAIKKSKKTNVSSSVAGGKSQIIALILCLLVGLIGIHRFYLGYVGAGIIQILTLGGLGIWTLIDLILIITGDLKPKDGEYDKTF